MSITARQAQLIQASFAKVAPIADQAAQIFYKKLFEYDPSLQKLFKGDMRSQGQKLMKVLGAAVRGLNDLPALIPVLQQLAQRHVGYGVKLEDYTPVGNALLFTLKTGLGDDFDDETRQAWVDLYRIVAGVMKEAHQRHAA